MAILEVTHLKKYFPVTGGVFLRRTGWIYAVDDISFTVEKGETLGIVGESGCGKTTLGRCIMGLYPPTDGQVFIKGRPIGSLTIDARRALSLSLQMIFQDPFESLDPRQTIRQILQEKYIIHKKGRKNIEEDLRALLDQVGLPGDTLAKFPHEFSGGQRQRIGIARAISLNPDIIVCDEPVSALDVSVQSKILNLLLELQQLMGLTYVFISHDLSVVHHMSDRIAVMYLGRIVEMADAGQIYARPCHPYTQVLISAIPVPDPESGRTPVFLEGEVPSVDHPPAGCRFHTRCPHAADICRIKSPELLPVKDDKRHLSACHLFR